MACARFAIMTRHYKSTISQPGFVRASRARGAHFFVQRYFLRPARSNVSAREYLLPALKNSLQRKHLMIGSPLETKAVLAMHNTANFHPQSAVELRWCRLLVINNRTYSGNQELF